LSLERARNWGLIGSVLTFIGIFLLITFPIGLILLLLSFRDLSRVYREPSIYSNALRGILALFIGIAALVALVVVAFMLASQLRGGIAAPPDIAIRAQRADAALRLLTILDDVILVAVVLASAYYMYGALETLSNVSQQDLFRLAGQLYAGGALGFLVGWLAMWLIDFIGLLIRLLSALTLIAGLIVLAVAFYKLESLEETSRVS